ncbi:WD40 repeat-like protein [Sistotremastrum niveocremeum HHB9708]|uniref:WD40 repeat-like protein n=1 Tax=Sistotremastrum niveocremeum HHB9708 TaxID=1314777 RepID=A0A164YTC6_9AGAM|nr:WD40 repeat-like protein [Sistotremastrum niveocremeum HHB9708]
MIQTGLISPAHDDLVCDAAFDFYGSRLATCSLDQRIKIWRMENEETGAWACEDEWKAHEAPIAKLSWAHPEFGAVIASASFDRAVKIWEQAPSFLVEQRPSGSGTARWIERALLTEAKGSVRAVEFAPSHFGLRLATLATDNTLRIYESLDQQHWNLSDSLDVAALPSSTPGTPHASNTVVATPTQTHANLDGGATTPTPQAGATPGHPGAGIKEADGGWSLSWCKDHYWGQILAVSWGTRGQVKIVQVSTPQQQTHTLLTLDPFAPSPSTDSNGDAEPPVTYAITSVSWAPSCGRSYHLIATGSRDGHVRIWRVRPPSVFPKEGEESSEKEKWAATLVGDFSEHRLSVGRVEWNVTGTILSSAGNDGRVRLWKATLGNVWRSMGSISAEQATEKEKTGEKDIMEE